jgi:single-stranded-DNA-specific exonuclease
MHSDRSKRETEGGGRSRGPARIEPIFKKIDYPVENSQVIAETERKAVQIAARCGIDPIVSRLLAERGFQADEKLDKFLTPSIANDLPTPLAIKNMDKACDLLLASIKSGTRVAICCDYDVDGTTSAAIMVNFLKKAGVEVSVLSPDRFESGYGLNKQMVDQVADEGCGLLLTLDFGTTNQAELAHAKSRGMKTLVLDHHNIIGTPPTSADVFVNPKQAGCGFANGDLCTAGLAWVFVKALKDEMTNGADAGLKRAARKINVDELLAFAALGTIADVVPLTDLNRAITREGLKQLSSSENAGLKALKHVSGIVSEVHTEDVAFGMGPRINAAGRMARRDRGGLTGAMQVVELLTSEDPYRAKELAETLNRYNIDRKKVEKKVRELAIKQLKLKGKPPAGLVVWGADFHEGVNGIVASRLVDTYNRPSVVLGVGQDGRLKGSVRGVPGFDVVKALEAVSPLLEKFGGHAGAGGLTVRKRQIHEFAKAFAAECEKQLKGRDLTPLVKPDVETSLPELKQVGKVLVEDLRKLEPCGMSNAVPKMLVRRAHVVSAIVQDDKHLKLMLRQGDAYMTALLWHQADHPALKAGSVVDIVCKPSVDKSPVYNPHGDKMQLEILAAQEARA